MSVRATAFSNAPHILQSNTGVSKAKNITTDRLPKSRYEPSDLKMPVASWIGLVLMSIIRA